MNSFNLKTGEPSQPVQPGLKVGRSLAQIVMVLVVLLVLVNVPLGDYTAGLAQLIPQTSAVIIQDGVMLKGSGPEIYIVEDYKLRLISQPETFNYYFHPGHVISVDDSLLEKFGRGQPVRRLVKCPNNSAIFALENGQKRWVKDPPPANAAKRWDRAVVISCVALYRLPDGLPIPTDAGLPPQP